VIGCHGRDTILALPAEDQDMVDQMFEDQGMDVQFDEPVPFNSPESEHDSESNGDEFSELSNYVSEWFVFLFFCSSFANKNVPGIKWKPEIVGTALSSKPAIGLPRCLAS